VFLVPVANLVISDAKIVVGRCVTAPSLFFLRELIVWSSLLCLVLTMVHLSACLSLCLQWTRGFGHQDCVATWPPDFDGFGLALERYVALTLCWVRLSSPSFVNLCVMVVLFSEVNLAELVCRVQGKN
jgi:hypothetical protein